MTRWHDNFVIKILKWINFAAKIVNKTVIIWQSVTWQYCNDIKIHANKIKIMKQLY